MSPQLEEEEEEEEEQQQLDEQRYYLSFPGLKGTFQRRSRVRVSKYIHCKLSMAVANGGDSYGWSSCPFKLLGLPYKILYTASILLDDVLSIT